MSQIKSLILPFTVLLVVPAIILLVTEGYSPGWELGLPYSIPVIASGSIFIVIGLYLLISTIKFFVTIGKGTLAPWSPTKKLVVTGIYRHVRNPMISGVLTVLLGESILFGSILLLCWFVFFLASNHFYFIYMEEPGLVKRFGSDYIDYKNNVPRWIPRLKPWDNAR